MKRANNADGHQYVPSSQAAAAALLAACIIRADKHADAYAAAASACLVALALEAAFCAPVGSWEADVHLIRARQALAEHGVQLWLSRRVAYALLNGGERVSVYADTQTLSRAKRKQRALS